MEPRNASPNSGTIRGGTSAFFGGVSGLLGEPHYIRNPRPGGCVVFGHGRRNGRPLGDARASDGEKQFEALPLE